VHQHYLDVGRHLGQGQRHRLLPLGAPGDDGHRGHRGQQLADRLDVGGWRGHHDEPDRRCGRDPADRVHEEGFPGEQAQGLGPARAEPQARAGRRNKDRDVTASIELRGHVAVLDR